MKPNLSQLTKFFVAVIISVSFFSCAPLTKESYLERYDEFIDEIKEEYETYTEEDWLDKDEKLEKFSGEWYDKFEEELTLKEELKITGLKAKYGYYRMLKTVKETYHDIADPLMSTTKEMKEKAQYYIENDMQDDLNELYKQAEEMGEETVKALEEICSDLEGKINELNIK